MRAAVDLEQLPDVDLLRTSLGPLPADLAGGLAVELRLDDGFGGRPSPLKTVLVGLLVLALVGTAAALLLADRGRARRPRPGWSWPGWIDVLVPAVLVGWLFVAPATDDDGWFATQARNAAVTGDVSSYYQLYDLSFTPFTWLYQVLSWWQQVAGTAPVVQRIPALVCGLLGWLVLRRYAARAVAAEPADDADRPRATATHLALGVVFLAWWLPYDMGVRPEGVVALCAAAALLAVLAAGDSGRLAPAWLACALAGIGVATHTTGVILLGPLLAGIGPLYRVVHVPGERWSTAWRGLAVVSGGMTALLLGFADGGLRDLRRGQTITESVLPQDGWADELQRYVFLLDPVPMGSYAKRAAVLACLVALVWFAVLAVFARARGVALLPALRLAAGSVAVGLAALALTPSKWSHHFGALAGVGSAFLALFLVSAVPLTRRLLTGARLPAWCLGLAAGSAVLAVTLSWLGPNSWPYAWLDGVRAPYLPPAVLGVRLGNPLLWGLVLAVLVIALVATGRERGDRRLRGLAAVPLLVLVSLLAGTGYLVSSFGFAAARGLPPESVWAQAVADPSGARCGTAGAVRVLDPAGARPLVAAGLPAPPVPTGFAPGGFHPNSPPPGEPGWGSLVARDGRPAEHSVGELSTGWFELPGPLPDGAAVTVTAAGSLDGGTTLTARYARRSGAEPAPMGAEPLTDPARSTAWRTFALTPPRGAELVRLDAVDASAADHGWLAFTGPAVQRPVPLPELFAGGGPVAVGWQIAFGFPCQRPPVVQHGVTEPPEFAVLRAEQPLAGLADLAWQPARGGVFGQVPRSRPVLQLATVGEVDPYLQVYRFGTDGLRRDGYRLTVGSRTVAGHDPTPG